MKYYKPTTSDTVSVEALIEHSDRGDYITFDRLLNDQYASYDPCSVKIPSEFRPEIIDNETGSYLKIALTADCAPVSDVPFLRLPMETKNGKLVTVFDVQKYKADSALAWSQPAGHPLQVVCEIVK